MKLRRKVCVHMDVCVCECVCTRKHMHVCKCMCVCVWRGWVLGCWVSFLPELD